MHPMLYVALVCDPAMAERLVAVWPTPADRAYAAGRKRPGTSLLALAALRALLSRVTGNADWRITRSSFGKPALEAGDGTAGPAISLSHTAGLTAVAIARGGSVGIDVEHHRQRHFDALADQALGPAERAEVAAGGACAFYRIWTLREAMAKATGAGLALAINRHDLVEGIASGHPARRDRMGRSWRLLHTAPDPAHSLGLAWYGGPAGAWPHWIDLAHALQSIPATETGRP